MRFKEGDDIIDMVDFCIITEDYKSYLRYNKIYYKTTEYEVYKSNWDALYKRYKQDAIVLGVYEGAHIDRNDLVIGYRINDKWIKDDSCPSKMYSEFIRMWRKGKINKII